MSEQHFSGKFRTQTKITCVLWKTDYNFKKQPIVASKILLFSKFRRSGFGFLHAMSVLEP